MDWISVKDRVPEPDQDVLVYNPKDGINLGEFDPDQVSEYDSGWTTFYEWAPTMSPTHWMPLPEPPKLEL